MTGAITYPAADVLAGLPLVSSHAEGKQSAHPNFKPDQPENIDRVVAHLETCAPSVEGHGGNNHAFAAASMSRDLGVSEDLTRDLMLKHFNPRCAPPWEADELQMIVHNAFLYAENDAGSKALIGGGSVFAHVQQTVARSDELRAVPFDPIILSRPVGPVEEVIPGLVEKGAVNILGGPGGSNKSRLGLQFALCVGAGHAVFGRQVAPTSSVFISSEDHADEVARRAQAIAARLELPRPIDATFLDRQGQGSALAVMFEGGTFELRPFYTQLRTFLRSRPGHKLIVLDSCYDFVAFAGKAKIDEGAVNAFIKQVLQGLCDDCDATLLVIWHPSQAGMEREDAAGWSVAWHNSPRARLSIAPLKDCEDAFELKAVKRNHAAKGKPITLHWTGGALLPLSDASIENREARIHAACVQVAILSAENGVPIQMHRRLLKWQLDEVEKSAGLRPTEREIKNQLHLAVTRGELRKVLATRHRMAGFYPMDPERAAELASRAKHLASTNEVPNE